MEVVHLNIYISRIYFTYTRRQQNEYICGLNIHMVVTRCLYRPSFQRGGAVRDAVRGAVHKIVRGPSPWYITNHAKAGNQSITRQPIIN